MVDRMTRNLWPRPGQPLYDASDAAMGCTNDSTCQSVMAVSSCNTTLGLCEAIPPTNTAPTTTTPKTNPSEMTNEIRNRMLTMHNWRRSQLALGNIRNGKQGNRNLPTAQNMLMMRYDMSLENEAQAYASRCPTSGSAVATRPASGENFALISSSSSALDAAVRVGGGVKGGSVQNL
ncbi:unnamed protein product [Strongylus vulgaris]|uniref:SCP domain-containing protein n=1 Tax=Strongylus vulgaris TaxID=40348 RepID=A0A3P7IWX6_STRVU|nr:unnamed protein product [Strongylus vulgaris]